MLSEQERCDFTYIMKDPDGIDQDIPVTSCRAEYEYPEGSGGGEEVTEQKDFYCPLNDEFDGEKTWGICNGGCFEDDENQSKLLESLTCLSEIHEYKKLKNVHIYFFLFKIPKSLKIK